MAELNNSSQQDPMDSVINEQKNLLAQQQEEREHNRIEIEIMHISLLVDNKEKEILAALSEKKAGKKAVLNICAGEIVRAAAGDITVTSYSQRAKAEQEVYLYVNTHWVLLKHQQFYDLINECCKKLGLTEDLYMDSDFMNNVCERVARLVAHDRNPYVPSSEAWINMQNGTLEIKSDGSLKLRGHNKDDFYTYVLEYAYDPQAECPLWLKFLDEVLPDKDAQLILAEYIGYCFTNSINAEKILVLFGFGSNGKSVVLDVIESLLGQNNVSNVGLADLTNDPEKLCEIDNKLANISHESGKEIDPTGLKKIASHEPVEGRKLWIGPVRITNYGQLITSFNLLPRAEATHGFYRRFIILPFNVTIDENDADTDLSKKLSKELAGILNWVLYALKGLLQRRTFSPCEVCKKALYEYKLKSDTAFLFFSECCEITTATTDGKQLYKCYKSFCTDGDEGLTPLGKNKFFERIAGISGVKRSEHNRTIYFNVSLKTGTDGSPF